MNRALLILFSISVAITISPAAEPGQWVNISDPIVKQLTDAGKKIAWPGQTAGVTVDRTTGDVYMIIPDQGIWKSADHGATFARADSGQIGGRCETGSSLNMDPAGGRLACFMLDGKCAMTLDAGKTWRPMTGVGRNWDFAAVNWADPQAQAIFAARHESGGEMYTSADGGKTWKMIAKDEKFAAVGIFDDKTLVTTKGDGILRSTDFGATWAKVSDLQPVGRVMVIFKGKAYWVGKDSLLVSTDDGATWQKQGTTVEAAWGPMLGKDEKHIVLAGKKGFLETTDAGQTWTVVAPLPKVKDFDAGRPGWFLNLAWDPSANIFYASRMGQGAYLMQR